MLYLIHRGNHSELSYKGGQGPIVHLEADMNSAINWAEDNDIHWAFTLSNAGAVYTQFRKSVAQLNQINWPAVAATKFAPPDIKEGKQAEFLVKSGFPWKLINRIGICSSVVAPRVYAALDASEHKPVVEVRQDWYF